MILVCGEALVDLFLEPTATAEIPALAVAGGSPFNVAIGLARLGTASAFCGGLSNDAFGRHLRDMLSREGVVMTHAIASPDLTTISVVATDSKGSPSYAFHGEGKADRTVTLDQLPSHLPPSIHALTFGSYTLAVEPIGSAYLTLARREKNHRVISLDPNIRPTVTPDIAAWHRRFAEFLDCATIIKASDEDIHIAYGGAADPTTVAKDWLKRGPKLVVVTRGPEGALAFTAEHEIAVPGRRVATIDTVGAGDTFHAAMLSRLQARGELDVKSLDALSHDAITDVVAYAVAASSITCSRRGADLPKAADVAIAFHERSAAI